jgi:hypothetical protein
MPGIFLFYSMMGLGRDRVAGTDRVCIIGPLCDLRGCFFADSALQSGCSTTRAIPFLTGKFVKKSEENRKAAKKFEYTQNVAPVEWRH